MIGTVTLSIQGIVFDRKRYHTKTERRTIITRWRKGLEKYEKYTITISPDEQLESTTLSQIKKFGCIRCYHRAFGDIGNVRVRGLGLLES